jgi:lipopolysaccharide export system protein LptA
MSVPKKTAVIVAAFLSAAINAAHAGGATSASTSPAPASAAKPAQDTPLKADTSKPINVNSDKLFADIKANIAIYTGHVVVTQDTLKMRADEVKVIAAQGKPTRLEARGNVVFDSATGSAIGEFGTYDINAHLITLTGKDVVLTKDLNVMHGTKLEMHTDTNLAQLYSQGLNNNRVQGLLVPKNGANQAAQPKSLANSKPGPAKP